jgi:signal transduction histidine kinase/DNA-binding response OmpR family regulator
MPSAWGHHPSERLAGDPFGDMMLNSRPRIEPSCPTLGVATMPHEVPEQEIAARDPPAPGPEPDGAPQRLQVLVVDDSERNLSALEAMLGDLDARFVPARSGEEALRLLLRQDFALVLLDVRMPGLDGFETAELIRQRERNRGTPIIFLTAYDGDREKEERGYALGAVDFLSKPVFPEVLRGKVAALIDLHRKSDELRRQEVLLREAERRDHERAMAAARQRWREESLRREVEREREASATLQRANARLRVLADAVAGLLRGAPLDAAPVIFAGAADLGAEVGLWYLGDEALALARHAGLEPGELEQAGAVSDDDPIAAAARERAKVVLGADAGARPLRGVAAAIGARAAVVFPLGAGARLHGALAFASRRRDGFEPEDVAALEVVAENAAEALERAALVALMSRQAEELRCADARKDEFLAMLGHELRNPLAPVVNALELVRRRDGDDPPLARAVVVARRQIDHMRRLLDDLLDVSRIRTGKIELRQAALDARDAVRDAVEETEALVTEYRHALEVALPPEPLPLDGDRVRLTQVVTNLLHNAAKYTQPGGHLSVRAGRDGTDVVITVRDDGIGIAPDVLPRVFDLFVQAAQGADRAHGGLGLGLTLARHLVEMHGGTLLGRSGGPGAGSEFEVRLPARADGAAGPQPGDPPSPRAAAHHLRVVLVEDSADIRETLRSLLELEGHAVAEAEDGRRGLELIRAQAPDVALVDIGLPGLDGYAVARHARAAAPGTRLVAMTGYGRPEDRRLALDAGFDAHVVKPVHFDDLSRLLAELC